MDWSINHTPERSGLTDEDGEDVNGFVREGSTTFVFEPVGTVLSDKEYSEVIDSVLSREQFHVGEDSESLYYRVGVKAREWSVYHVAVQKDCITLFVRDATTEKSVKSFYRFLGSETDFEWSVTKEETDITGTGENN
jgi:hypothetical protein